MKTWFKSCLFILIIILIASCNRSKNDEKTLNTDDDLVSEIAPAAEYIEEIDEYTDITDYIVNLFSERAPGLHVRNIESYISNHVTSIESIRVSEGYYIQKTSAILPELRGNFYGYCPEILTLSVENDAIYVREVDIIDDQIIIRNVKQLSFNGETFVHDDTELEIHDGKVQIIYSNIIPDQQAAETWDYLMPFRFAGTLDSLPDDIRKLTSGHLNAFAGEYIFDTFVIIDTNDPYINEDRFKNKILKITFDHENKCLLLTSDLFNTLGIPLDYLRFTETADEEPFFWIYDDDAGYKEIILYFYKDGIILLHDSIAGSDSGYEVAIKKYGVFFRKNLQ